MENSTHNRSNILEILQKQRFSLKNENHLQMQISHTLSSHNIPHKKKVILSPKNRIDFLLPHGLKIKVKINHAGTSLLRQIERYCKETQIQTLIVITIRPTVLSNLQKSKRFSVEFLIH